MHYLLINNNGRHDEIKKSAVRITEIANDAESAQTEVVRDQ